MPKNPPLEDEDGENALLDDSDGDGENAPGGSRATDGLESGTVSGTGLRLSSSFRRFSSSRHLSRSGESSRKSSAQPPFPAPLVQSPLGNIH